MNARPSSSFFVHCSIHSLSTLDVQNEIRQQQQSNKETALSLWVLPLRGFLAEDGELLFVSLAGYGCSSSRSRSQWPFRQGLVSTLGSDTTVNSIRLLLLSLTCGFDMLPPYVLRRAALTCLFFGILISCDHFPFPIIQGCLQPDCLFLLILCSQINERAIP